MVRACANPDCGAIFRYLHEGRLFAFELAEHVPTNDGGFGAGARAARFLWLCSVCSRAMTIAIDPNRTATLVQIAKAA